MTESSVDTRIVNHPSTFPTLSLVQRAVMVSSVSFCSYLHGIRHSTSTYRFCQPIEPPKNGAKICNASTSWAFHLVSRAAQHRCSASVSEWCKPSGMVDTPLAVMYALVKKSKIFKVNLPL